MRFSVATRPAFFSLLVGGALACTPSTALRPAAATAPTSAPTLAPAQAADPALDTRGAPLAPLAWATFDGTAFARARTEHKLVLLDGAAEWCHWCHVMEATTYHDVAVRRLLDAHFVSAKVDVDARPDIEERYGAYGWPATVVFSADGKELGKYRGYIAPDAFVEILHAVASGEVGEAGGGASATRDAATAKAPLTEGELAWIERMTELELADYYDDANGGWGKWQKAAVAPDNEWLLRLAQQGDGPGARAAKEEVLFTLEKQSALIDPVWGGIYQYSAASDWDHPHFEKLMTFQAGALENYSDAYALTRDPKWLAIARTMRSYIDRFLTSPEGGFYATQDADLNAHEPGKRFMTGHEYYPLDDAHRRALGVPRVDRHEYGKENGLAIGAYVRFYEATGDASALAAAARAAKRILSTHATARGGITHDGHAAETENPREILHLADNAAFGLGLMQLASVTEAPAKAEYLAAAAKIGDCILRDLADERSGGFFASGTDPDAVGVFAVRRKPVEDNLVALRMLARLARVRRAERDEASAARYAGAIANALRSVVTPEAIKGRGRILGDLLLALEETRGVR